MEITLETTPLEDKKDYTVAMTMMTRVWGAHVTTKFESPEESKPEEEDTDAVVTP